MAGKLTLSLQALDAGITADELHGKGNCMLQCYSAMQKAGWSQEKSAWQGTDHGIQLSCILLRTWNPALAALGQSSAAKLGLP